MPPVSADVVKALYKLFIENFDLGELEELAFALDIDFQNIPGDTRNAKARELAGYISRRGLMGKLRQIGPQERPELDWDSIFGGALPPPPPLLEGRVPGPELNPIVSAVAAHPDFAATVDRKNMLSAAGVLRYAAGIDLAGAERPVSLRVLTQLNNVSAASDDGHTPLGDFLRYFSTLPEVFHLKPLLEEIIAKYRL